MSLLVPHRRRLWLYAVTALTLVFLVAPIAVIVPMSFSGSRFLEFPPKVWSLRWYESFLADATWTGALLLSLKLAAATAVIATPLGVAAAYALHTRLLPSFRRLQTVLLLPLMVPHIILAVGLFYMYAKFGWLGSFPALLAANVMMALPFIVVTTTSGLRDFDMNQELAARSMGCSRFEAFRRVTLPQISGSVSSGVVFAFATALDEVVIALFVSSGDNTTVTKVMFSSLRDEIDPTIAAVSALMIGTVLALTMLSRAGAWAFRAWKALSSHRSADLEVRAHRR
jgi:putative spermidine/putrescine transport system permease protein